MNRPRPDQLIQVLPVWGMPPPLMPAVPQPEPPPAAPAPEPEPQATPRRRRRRFRAPHVLREDAFWTGALTAMCIGGLLMAIIATS
jgi:hypothetical protein